MPLFPDMQDEDPTQPPDFSNMKYSSGDEFSAAFHAGISALEERALATTPWRTPEGLPETFRQKASYPLPEQPGLRIATSSELDERRKNRKGLEIPDGVTLDLADAMVQRYDDDKYAERVYEHPAGLVAKISAFGGSGASGLLDVPSSAVGGAVGKLALAGFKPLAKQLLEKLAAKEIFGSKAAQVATAIADTVATHTVGAVAGVTGYQAGVEAETQQERKVLGLPTTYINSLQNIGKAPVYGIILGPIGAALHIGLHGVEVPRGTTEIPPEGGEPPPGQFVREGGLLNSEAFKDVSQKTKDVIGRFYLPWSKDADITMKEEATGQMLNGQAPNLDVILKQGQVDEGKNFRGILKEQGIDSKELSDRLEDANTNINNQLTEIGKAREALKESDKLLAKDEGRSIKENKEMSQAGLMKRYSQAQFEPSFMENVPETIPENLAKHVEVQQQISKLKAKIKESKDVEPNKQTVRRIAQLEKRQPKILTPKEELKAIKKKLLTPEGLPEGFEESNAYKRLTDLSKVWTAAKNLLDRVHLERDHGNKINDLVSQSLLVDSIKKHVDDTHEPVTQDDMKDYSDHLKSIGIPKSEYVLPEAKDVSIDEKLNDFDSKEIKELLERPELKELKEEYEQGEKRINNQPKFADMVRQMVTCIYKGGA